MRQFVIGLVAVTMGTGLAVLHGQTAAPRSAAAAPAAASASVDLVDGQRVFQQNCSFCHIATANTTKAYGPKLHKGIVADAQKARSVIMTGQRLMPGFQYALTPAQVDSVIAFLGTMEATGPIPPPGPHVTFKPLSSSSLFLLTGNIKSAKGENMEGVMVSAKGEGQTVTTSVLTDKDGNYYFPQMGGGTTYRVWAQAIGFENGRASVTASGATKRQDFQLKETTDFVRQLSGGQYIAALPLDTSAHRRMRDIFVHNCTTCHSAATALQSKFDEAGWNAIVTSMLKMSGTAVEGRVIPHLAHFQKELVTYLTEMRGPGTSPMQFKVPARPTGAATMPVTYVYDTPLEEWGGYYAVHDGSDWSLGVASNSWGVRAQHDASIDFDGNIWVTHLPLSKNRTYGKIDGKTGAFTDYKVEGARAGFAAGSHGFMRAPDGAMWMNVSGSAGAGSGDGEGAPGSLGRIDVKTGKIQIFTPPAGIPGIGGHVDWDGKGYIWGSTNPGAARLDPRTGEWKSFESITKKNSTTYGVAADRNGRGWWAEINIDKVGYTDEAGNVKEFSIPKNTYPSEKDVTPEDMAFYEATGATASNVPPWQQGPRRLSTDKNGDDVWFGLFAGANLMRLNSRTMEHKIYPLPGTGIGAYMPTVSSDHRVWIGAQGDDTVNMLDPKTEKWTVYLWPVRGAAPRHLSVSDRNGYVEVVTAFWGVGKSGRMVMRSDRDIQALKSQVQAAR